ncbi:MAG: hypothetical protein IKR82_06155 [Bacteroidales bacterium]|nr:hypothetical protein [Bacteroidales bacterium]
MRRPTVPCANKTGLDYITTSHTPRKEYGQVELFKGQLINGYTIRELWHSHPESFWASDDDMSFKRAIIGNMLQYDQRVGILRNAPYFIVYTALLHFPMTFVTK